eukprot:3725909-Pyramimonas_sp.AAC.1
MSSIGALSLSKHLAELFLWRHEKNNNFVFFVKCLQKLSLSTLSTLARRRSGDQVDGSPPVPVELVGRPDLKRRCGNLGSSSDILFSSEQAGRREGSGLCSQILRSIGAELL